MRTPKIPPPLEHAVQRAIVDALRLAGLQVYETTAFRQTGPSGVDKAIPDLLVVHPDHVYCFIGLEVKRPGKIRWSPEQKAAFELNHFVKAQSPEEALDVLLVLVSRPDARSKIHSVLFALRRSSQKEKEVLSP